MSGLTVGMWRIRIQMPKFAGLDARLVNEVFDVGLLETDDAAEFVCRQLAVIDQAVQRSWRNTKLACRFLRTQPLGGVTIHFTAFHQY